MHQGINLIVLYKMIVVVKNLLSSLFQSLNYMTDQLPKNLVTFTVTCVTNSDEIIQTF
jgi:hypothetical protein